MWQPGNTLKLPQRTVGGTNVSVRQGSSVTTISAAQDSNSYSHPVLPLPDQEVGEWYRKNKINLTQTDWEGVQAIKPIDGGGGPISNSSSDSPSLSPSNSFSSSISNSVSNSTSASSSISASLSPSPSPSASASISTSVSISNSLSISASVSNSSSVSPSMSPSVSPSVDP